MYDAAFKKEAIRLVEEQGERVATVARKPGVTNKTMYRRIGAYRQDGEQAFPTITAAIPFPMFP